MPLSCPKSEVLLEFISIPKDISFFQRFKTQWHARKCPSCRHQIAVLRKRWESFFAPEPDVTSSLLKVYSRLQNDETLILKGWKLGAERPKPHLGVHLLQQGWFFRGAVSVGLGGFVVFFAMNQWQAQKNDSARLVQETFSSKEVPMAQIRIEEKDRVKVRYVEPELLQSIEFETTGMSR